MRELIFVDTETTGLESDPYSQLVELSWARREGEIKTLYFGVIDVPHYINDLIKFDARGIAGWQSTPEEIEEFEDAINGNIMVAANPAFDKFFISQAGLFGLHYRMLDIESYAMAMMGLPEVPGMKGIYDALTAAGHELTAPNHTSAADVAALREAFLILEQWNKVGFIGSSL